MAPCVLDCSLLGVPHPVLDLGEGLLDRIEVWGIGRQVPKPGTGGPSGIFADEAWKGVTGGAIISGALHSFVLSAAIELPRALRINVVSPTMVADSAADFSHLFPGMEPAPMNRITKAYVRCIEGPRTGEIVRIYR